MANQKAKIDIAGKDYILEFDRKSIIFAEEVIGFNLAQYEKTPVASAYKLFAGGLHKNHPQVKIENKMKLLDTYKQEDGDVEAVLGFLIEAYVGFLQTTQKPTKTIELL